MAEHVVIWESRLEMLRELNLNDPKVSVELGVDQGEFSRFVIDQLQAKRHFMVDTWATERFNEAKMNEVEQKFADEINLGKAKIIREESINAATLFSNSSVDFCYVDTDHSYAQTYAELLAWAPKIASGGVLAGDDFSVGNPKSGISYGVIHAVLDFLKRSDFAFEGISIDRDRNFSFCLRRREHNKA